MKVDGPFYAQLGDAAAEAKRLADIGYDGLYCQPDDVVNCAFI